MVTGPADLEPDSASDRMITIAAVYAAMVIGVIHVVVRSTTTLAGTTVAFSLVVLAAEIVLMSRALFPLLAVLSPRVDAQVPTPVAVPRVDVVVVVRDERPLDLRLALLSCRELRGVDGIVAVGGSDSRAAARVCRSMGVPYLSGAVLEGLGSEAERPAPLVLIVPASAWVSPDAAVVVAPALWESGVGAATGRTIVHGAVDLLGSIGYPLEIDRYGRPAAQLDAHRCAPPLDGPLLVRRDALRAVGGVDWTMPRPELDLHERLRSAGFGTRFVHPPIAYRMAPTDEGRALVERGRRIRAWRDAARRVRERSHDDAAAAAPAAGRRAPAPWAAWCTRQARLESIAVFARLTLVFTPFVVALSGWSAVSLTDPLPVALSAATWVIATELARRRAGTASVISFARVREGIRTLGVDLVAWTSSGNIARRARTAQLSILGAMLFSVVSGTLAITADSAALPRRERVLVGAALVAIALLVRDATTAYRQQRVLPRVEYTGRGSRDVVDLSPTGYTVVADLPVGSGLVTAIDLPFADGRVESVRVSGTVEATRVRDGQVTSYVAIETDHETFEQLIYFCAVTAPTITWLGGTPRVVQRPFRASARTTADLSG